MPPVAAGHMDYAGPVMTDEPLPLTHQQRLALTAADDPPPGWVWPSLLLGTVMPALLAGARREADLLRRIRPAPGQGRLGRIGELPGLPAAVLVGTALVLAVLFGFVRLGISDVYTESWLFLALALLLGLASPAAGLVLTLAFIPFDLLAAITRGSLDPLVPALDRPGARLVAAVAARGGVAAHRAPGPGRGPGHVPTRQPGHAPDAGLCRRGRGHRRARLDLVRRRGGADPARADVVLRTGQPDARHHRAAARRAPGPDARRRARGRGLDARPRRVPAGGRRGGGGCRAARLAPAAAVAAVACASRSVGSRSSWPVSCCWAA